MAGAIVVLTWGPVGLRPQYGYPQLERFLAYLLLGVVFSVAYPRRPRWVAIGLAAAAVCLEIGQNFFPGRDAHVVDALIKVLGAVAGVLSIQVLRTAGRARG